MTKTSSVPRRFPARSRSPTSSRRSTKPPTSVDGFTPLETTATRASPPFVSGSPFVRRLDLVDTNTHPSRRVAFRSRSTDASVSTRGRRRSLSLSLSLLSSRLLSSRLVAPRHRLSRAVAFFQKTAARGAATGRRHSSSSSSSSSSVVVVRRTSDVDGERVR